MALKTSQQVDHEFAADMAKLLDIVGQLPLLFPPSPLRKQTDNHDAITQANGLRCPPEENKTRQEFKDEADINQIVGRFYPFAPPVNPVRYGVQDMGLDLHSAMLSMQSAREAYAEAPPALRAAFPSFNEFLAAFMDGKLEFFNPSGEDGGGSSPPASSEAASDSAPVPPATPVA